MTSDEEYLYLTTKGWKTGNPHEIEIWFVRFGASYYLISERYENAHWVRNITYDPHIQFRVGSISFVGLANIIDEGIQLSVAERVSELMKNKYGWNKGLIVELTPTKRLQ